MKDESMKMKNNRLTDKQLAESKHLGGLSDDKINVDEIPEMTDWTGAQHDVFYKPVKQQITVHLDADIIRWLKAGTPEGRGYQTAINRALRNYINRQVNPHSTYIKPAVGGCIFRRQ